MQPLDAITAKQPLPLFRLGFRPFFLFAPLFALVVIPLWLAGFFGYLGTWQPTGGWLAWHRHEMIFGFACAIIAGFLLTAVKNWTGVATVSGSHLLVLSLVWLAARLAWLAGLPLALVAPLDAAFLLLLLTQIAYCIIKVKQLRNYPIIFVLLVLSALNILSLYGLFKGNDLIQRQAELSAVWAIAAIITIIAGRVIPFFTVNGLRLSAPVKPWPVLDYGLLILTLLVALSFAIGKGLSTHTHCIVLFAVLAIGHSLRLVRWYHHGIWRVPLLWCLYLAYGWLIIAFIMMALWHAGLISNSSAAIHAFTVGAMTGLILAMMSRVSLGHTGRPLIAPKLMMAAYALINIAAILRVFGIDYRYLDALWLAAIAWSLSFLIYLIYYAPMLCKARVDGRPG